MKVLLKILILMGSVNFLNIFADVKNYKNLTPVRQCALYKVNFAKTIKFAKRLQLLVEKNNAKILSTLIAYPLRINQGVNSYYFIKNKDEFIHHYRDIFTPLTRNRILQGRTNDILCNDQGIALFSGSAWCQPQPPDNKTISIFVINITTG